MAVSRAEFVNCRQFAEPPGRRAAIVSPAPRLSPHPPPSDYREGTVRGSGLAREGLPTDAPFPRPCRDGGPGNADRARQRPRSGLGRAGRGYRQPLLPARFPRRRLSARDRRRNRRDDHPDRPAWCARPAGIAISARNGTMPFRARPRPARAAPSAGGGRRVAGPPGAGRRRGPGRPPPPYRQNRKPTLTEAVVASISVPVLSKSSNWLCSTSPPSVQRSFSA